LYEIFNGIPDIFQSFFFRKINKLNFLSDKRFAEYLSVIFTLVNTVSAPNSTILRVRFYRKAPLLNRNACRSWRLQNRELNDGFCIRGVFHFVDHWTDSSGKTGQRRHLPVSRNL